MPEKPLLWLGSSWEDILAFPEDARRLAGFQLRRVQQGLEAPSDGWPRRSRDRIHTATEHRIIYVAALTEAVYVVHAFAKRTRKTAKQDLDLARDRLRQLVRQRRARHER
jgi:phage-related protein